MVIFDGFMTKFTLREIKKIYFKKHCKDVFTVFHSFNIPVTGHVNLVKSQSFFFPGSKERN